MRLDPDSDWLQDVERLPSPNYDQRPPGAAIDLLVLHNISLPPRCYGGEAISQLFLNRLDCDSHPYYDQLRKVRVSAHVLIRRDGHIIQYVAFSDRAWHAGESCFCDRPACNDYSIGVELEGCDEEPYEAVQYRRLAKLCSLLIERWPAISAQRIVGHSDIAPGRKTDPGPKFDWQTFRRLLRFVTEETVQ
jgi:AmpD protein